MKMRINRSTAISATFIIVIFSIFLLTSAVGWRSVGYSVYSRLKKDIAVGTPLAQTTKDALSTFETVYNDLLFSKSRFAKLGRNTQFILTGSIESTQITLGKDKWLFYTNQEDGNPLSDYLGTNYYSEKELAETCQALSGIQQALNSRGTELVVMILPNKEQIYDKYMPEDIIRESSTSKTDLLVEYLRANSSLPMIYPKAELLENRDDYQLYYKYDSHWNQLGAFIAEQQLLSLEYDRRSYLRDCTITADGSKFNSDLADMLSMQWKFNDDKQYRIKGNETADSSNGVDYFNNAAPHHKKIMLIGDSFRNAIRYHLQQDFSEIAVLHRDEYAYSMLEERQPDIVILEYVERYVDKILQFKLS